MEGSKPDEPFRFTLGAYRCLVFNDSQQDYAYHELADNLSAGELAQVLAAHGLMGSRTTMDYNVLLVDTGEHTVLVDAGDRGGALRTQLKAAGISPADIDLIYLTHADEDHIGGLVDDEGGLNFPNASILMWQGMWDLWSAGAPLSDDENIPWYFIRHVVPAIRARVEPVELEGEFLPGFRAIYGRGHGPDHSALRITCAGETLLHIADAVHHLLHISYPDLLCYWDRSGMPGEVVRTRRQLFERAVEEGALVFGPHLPFPGLGWLSEREDGWGMAGLG